MSGESPLVRELSDGTAALVRDHVGARPSAVDPGAVLRDLRAWSAEVAVPVRDGRLMAIILVGPKLSGDSFFGDELDLLETLASELAIGLKNAQLYHEIVSIKEYNERLLGRMDSGVIAARDDGVVTTLNPAAERILGIEAARVVGRSLDVLDPAIRAVLRSSLVEHVDSETEVTVSHPEGRVLPLVVHTSALHDHKGEVSGAIAVLNDHSRLKALEEDKRRTDRLSALGAMATGIAHEIRNPLVAIKTFAELLPERADDHEFRSTFAKVAVKEIHRIEQLLGRLRALAVPSAFPLRPLDLQVPLAETLDLLRGEADRRRVRTVVEIEPDLPPVLGELDQLKQLFLNLFLNGLEAMTAGGTLTITVRADRERADRGLVTVRVTDTGPGIPREDLARVFEPFFTTKSSGTGLGLAICRSIADAHRAALWADPGPAGLGTTFVVQFPTLVGVGRRDHPAGADAVRTIRVLSRDAALAARLRRRLREPASSTRTARGDRHALGAALEPRGRPGRRAAPRLRLGQNRPRRAGGGGQPRRGRSSSVCCPDDPVPPGADRCDLALPATCRTPRSGSRSSRGSACGASSSRSPRSDATGAARDDPPAAPRVNGRTAARRAEHGAEGARQAPRRPLRHRARRRVLPGRDRRAGAAGARGAPPGRRRAPVPAAGLPGARSRRWPSGSAWRAARGSPTGSGSTCGWRVGTSSSGSRTGSRPPASSRFSAARSPCRSGSRPSWSGSSCSGRASPDSPTARRSWSASSRWPARSPWPSRTSRSSTRSARSTASSSRS